MHHKKRIIFAYKNFAANRNVSHIGLGVAGINTSKVLTHEGYIADVWPILDGNHLRMLINLDRSKHRKHAHLPPITHVNISAPWIKTEGLNQLCTLFPDIRFSVNCHSNVGFLQADPSGMKLIREGLELELAVQNFTMAANSEKMCEWVRHAYGSHCEHLPNLYYLGNHMPRHHQPWRGGVLKIGIFGATRPQKNLASAVGAAIEMAYELKAQTQIWISSGRTEGGGGTIINTVRAMVDGLPDVTLHEGGWRTWPAFRKLIGSMHLLLQPSYTESFNMVTADGIAEGVPSVVGEAIHWVPRSWQANVDEVFEIAQVGRYLLNDHFAARDGMNHLKNYVQHGVRAWGEYLREK